MDKSKVFIQVVFIFSVSGLRFHQLCKSSVQVITGCAVHVTFGSNHLVYKGQINIHNQQRKISHNLQHSKLQLYNCHGSARHRITIIAHYNTSHLPRLSI